MGNHYTEGGTSFICICCHKDVDATDKLDMPTRFFVCNECYEECQIEFRRLPATFPNWLRAIAVVAERKFYKDMRPVVDLPDLEKML